MLIVFGANADGTMSATAVSEGPPVRWHVWMASQLVEAPGIGRVALRCMERGSMPSLGAEALRPVRSPRIPTGIDYAKLGSAELRHLLSEAADVWEFRIGRYNGRPPLVREIGERDLTFSIALAKRGVDGPPILDRGLFPIHESYAKTVDDALRACTAWPAKILRLAAMGIPAQTEPEIDAVEGQRQPAAIDFARFAFEIARRNAAKAYRRLFVMTRWNVGVVERPVTLDVPISSTSWLPVDPHYFLADPMVSPAAGGTEILCEYYPYETGVGEIAVVGANGTTSEPRHAIRDGHHLSYPFVLEHDGATYCLPENAAAGKLSLYRAIRYPQEWEKVGTVLDGVPAIDPTMIRHEDRWWLFATRRDTDYNTHLFLWYADGIHGPWREHPANPVKSDVTGARPAGNLFRIDGKLYRPAQDCSERYGAAVTLHQIVELTPHRFREVRVRRVAPIEPYPHGLHTLSSAADRFVIDGRRDFVDLRKPVLMLRRAIATRRRSRQGIDVRG